MSRDADTVREALGHMTYNGPVTRAAKAALARLEIRAAQRDALGRELQEHYDAAALTCSRIGNGDEDDPDLGLLDFYEGKREAFKQALALFARAALAEAATHEETTP